ncbi:gliding motility-associated C-terminal domain-containing protein [bacterium]|nr:gliding motility-associated C-terminal domain-containing protein [bacterium]
MAKIIYRITTVSLILLLGIVFADSSSDRKARLFGKNSSDEVKIEITSSNDDIGVLVEGTGMFSIGTSTGKALLYGYPYSARTSHCHFYVDGDVAGTYSDSSDVHPVPAELIEFPHLVGDTVICKWLFNGVEFSQKLIPVYIGEDAQIRIEYNATNVDATSHLVGLLLFLDTMIGTNDCAPIATPVGYFATEQQFMGELPSFWQAFEESPFQDETYLVGQGTLSGWSATPPDILLYGDFWHYHSTWWDYSFVGGIYSDSSVLLRWNAHLLPAGESRTFITYYGIGSTARSLGEVSLSITAPAQIMPSGCSGFYPDTFVVNLLVGCTDTLRGAVANIELPSFLRLLDDAEKPISPAVLMPGGIGTASWNVTVNLPSASAVDSLMVELYAAGYSPVAVSREISIVRSNGIPPDISLISEIPPSLETDSITVSFNISDSDGIDTTSISVLLDGEALPFDWSYPVLRVHLSGLTAASHHLEIPGIKDIYGCTAEPFVVDFIVNPPSPPQFSVLTPEVGSFTACADDTIKILVISEGEWDIADFSLNLDGSLLPLGRLGDTLMTFYDALSDGEHTIEVSYSGGGETVDSVWNFFIDRTPPYINLSSMIFELRTPSDLISFSVDDDGAGVDFSEIAVQIGYGDDTVSLSSTSPGISVDDGRLGILLSETGLYFGGCAEITVSLNIPDSTGKCGPNVLDTVALRTEVPCTPPEIYLLSPTGATSCDSINVAILLIDDEGIVADSAYVIFGGVRYDIGSPYLYLSGDTLFFTILVVEISAGEHNIDVGGITDSWGNSIVEGTSINIYIDREPPVIDDILPDSVLYGSESVSFVCHDDVSGISTERSFIVCDGDTISVGTGLTFEDGVLSVPSAVWLSALGGDSLTICCHIVDDVVECAPNFVDSCVVFPVEQSGPAATMIYPQPNKFLGCESQNLKILWFDPDGIDRTASTISFGGEVFPSDDARFHWNGDTVSFNIDLTEFEDNVSIVLHGVDEIGFSSDTSFVFGIDRTSPSISVISPVPGSRISYPYEQWKILLDDNKSGIDPGAISIIVDGDLFTLLDGAVNLRGDTLIFDANVADMDFGNAVDVAVHCSDNSAGCPNDAQMEWSYEVFHPDMWWELLSPLGVVSCDTVNLKIAVHTNFDVDYSDVHCIVAENSVNYDVSNDTITAEIPGTMLTSGVNAVSLTGFSNAESGLPVDDTIFAAIIYDALPPSVVPVYPVPGSRVPAGSQLMAVVYDDISGVDVAGVMVDVNGNALSLSSDNWRGDTVVVAIPRDITGDVEVCITAADMPQVCDPNEMRLCWQFTIPGAGPQITIIEPTNGAYSHNRRQKIVASLCGENEINIDDITMTVNGSIYDIHSGFLTFSSGTLEFTPSEEWNDGEEVEYKIRCTDELDLSTEIFGNFKCDFSPPTCSNPFPEGVVQGVPQKISIDITDDGVGVDPQSIVFRVGELFIEFDNYALIYDGTKAILDLSRAGVHLSALDTIDVGVIAVDYNTGYGAQNVMENCEFWFFPVKSGCSVGPTPFTPNGDGINDNVEFAVYSDETIKVSIYTMDGVAVRELEGQYVVLWDGRDNYGRNAPAGPYLYIVEGGGKILKKGTVVIAR